MAQAIFGCYRRDEAHDPEGFVAALTAILSDYPASVVNYAADPRTGVATEFPMGLPNVGQIKQFCDGVARRHQVMNQVPRRVVRSEPPPVLPGQETYAQFLARCERNGLEPRPIGRFEQGEYQAGERSGQTQKEKELLASAIQRANKIFWEIEKGRRANERGQDRADTVREHD
jgi:hypothetical protein